MDLIEAVSVLNERQHRGVEWYAVDGDRFGVGYRPLLFECDYTDFEIIAVAEKYVREAAATPTPVERAEPYLMPGRNVRRW